MPCDSAGAGLVALGSMIRDFGDERSNDVDGHYDRLLRYAKQYLEKCKPCILEVCNPQIQRCDCAKEAIGSLLRSHGLRGTFELSERTNFQKREIVWLHRYGRNKCYTETPSPNEALNYHIDGEPPLELRHDQGKLNPLPYQAVLPDAKILDENLARSYSGTCLAMRASAPEGQPQASREMFQRINFRCGHNEWPLDTLLTINGWSGNTVSRVASFNCRTLKLDRTGINPKLVIADGRKAFLRCVGQEEFHESDIIGIVDRNQKREELDEIRAKVTPNDWYCTDEDLLCSLPKNKPNGISIAAIKKGN